MALKQSETRSRTQTYSEVIRKADATSTRERLRVGMQGFIHDVTSVVPNEQAATVHRQVYK